jgi:hypothetical protein
VRNESDKPAGPETKPSKFTADGRHLIPGHNDGRFRAPTTRIAGSLLIAVGILYAFSSTERWKSPYIIVLGVVVLTFARYLRHFVSPDRWYIAEDDHTE